MSPRSFALVSLIGSTMLVVIPPDVGAEDPEIISQWGVAGNLPGQLWDLRGIAVDGEGNVFLVDRNRLQKFTNDGTFIYRVTRGTAGSLDTPGGVAVDDSNIVYVSDTYNQRIQTFTNEGVPLASWGESAPPLYWPLGIAVGEYVYVHANGAIRKYTRNGESLLRWGSGNWSGLAVDDHERIYHGDNESIRWFSSDGTPLVSIEDEPGFSWALAVDDRGFIYSTDGTAIHVFDQEGVQRARWGSFIAARGLALDLHGNLYVADAGQRQVIEYARPEEFPPGPLLKPSAVMLHVAPVVKGPCSLVPASIEEIVTQAAAARDGSAQYLVYILARPEEGKGLAGIQLGIEYTVGMNPGEGIQVDFWRACSDLEFTGDSWPSPGSGNTLTWEYGGNCQEDPIVAAGYFQVTAYSAGVMEIANFPYTGVVKTATCAIMERLPDRTLGLEQVGWVSLGGGAIGTDSDGCNPLLEPCAHATTPTRGVTWGRLKTLFDRGE